MGIGWPQILIVLVIVLLLFGTKRLRNVGSDLGEAIKGFRTGMKDKDAPDDKDPERLGKDETPEARAARQEHEKDKHDAGR